MQARTHHVELLSGFGTATLKETKNRWGDPLGKKTCL